MNVTGTTPVWCGSTVSQRGAARFCGPALALVCIHLCAAMLFAQNAAPADRNAVNTTARPGDMLADSPVTFPKEGALPAKFPPDVKEQSEPAERDYYLFSSPCRSLAQIARIQSELPPGEFTAPPPDWKHLQRTRRILTGGGELRVLALGDSIVNDTMRSGWVARLREAYPKASIQATVYVRGGGGCQHYREEDRVAKYIVPRKPDLVFIGGISQRSSTDIREVIRQLRAGLPAVEILLATGAFGTVDPRDPSALAQAPHSGTGPYGKALRALAAEERCAFLDLTAPWAEYIRSSKLHPHLFYRDVVHANEFGEQILAKIMLSFWTASTEPVGRGASAAGLRFAPAADGGVSFDTGVLRGSLRAGGKSLGLTSVIHLPTGRRLDRSNGLFSHYRVFSKGVRYGGGAWDWPSTARLLEDGGVEVNWPSATNRPFAMQAIYRWSSPAELELETSVEPHAALAGFEVFLASYFDEAFTNAFAYVKGDAAANREPKLLAAEPSLGDWLMFPRSQEMLPLIQDGRWRLEPNPVAWTILPELARPLAVRRQPAGGLTAILRAPVTDCFAIAMPQQHEAHYSVYLSLFGKDLAPGQTARAKAHLRIIETASENDLRSLAGRLAD